MTRFITKRSEKKRGKAPGALVYVGERREGEVKIHVIHYDSETVHEESLVEPESAGTSLRKTGVTWLNVEGVHDEKIIQKFGNSLNLHSLLQEDVLNTGHRPKFEEFSDHLFVILKMLIWNPHSGRIEREHVSLVCGSGFVVSFQEDTRGDAFEMVRQRILKNVGRIRQSGSDYLLMALMRGVVDDYFEIMERMGEQIEALQDEAMSDPDQKTLKKIHFLRSEMMYFRKAVRPLREVMRDLERSDHKLLDPSTHSYFRDLSDHVMQILDAMETYREMLSGMIDIYLSSLSNKMNSEMKILSLVATIFIPLTFIAGIYGMNFAHMPELQSPWGYPLVIGIMVVVALGMLFFFKRRHWF